MLPHNQREHYHDEADGETTTRYPLWMFVMPAAVAVALCAVLWGLG